jgi:hypothetical protein
MKKDGRSAIRMEYGLRKEEVAASQGRGLNHTVNTEVVKRRLRPQG